MVAAGFLLAAGAAWGEPPSAEAVAEARAQVLMFAQSSLGYTVGDGECTALAAQALRAARAKRRAKGDAPGDGDYVWGDLILTVEAAGAAPRFTGDADAVRPGDIAQFRDARFPGAHYPHHTAVVAGLRDNRLALLQQNIGGKRFVTKANLRVDKISEGWLRIYRPVPRP